MTKIDLARFEASLKEEAPPAGLAPPAVALWHLGREEWDEAHGIAQSAEGDPDHDWVHAHLHRVEGDLGNAGYWYRRAGRPVPRDDLKAEWRTMAEELLRRR